jgi:hypothetical protein
VHPVDSSNAGPPPPDAPSSSETAPSAATDARDEAAPGVAVLARGLGEGALEDPARLLGDRDRARADLRGRLEPRPFHRHRPRPVVDADQVRGRGPVGSSSPHAASVSIPTVTQRKASRMCRPFGLRGAVAFARVTPAGLAVGRRGGRHSASRAGLEPATFGLGIRGRDSLAQPGLSEVPEDRAVLASTAPRAPSLPLPSSLSFRSKYGQCGKASQGLGMDAAERVADACWRAAHAGSTTVAPFDIRALRALCRFEAEAPCDAQRARATGAQARRQEEAAGGAPAKVTTGIRSRTECSRPVSMYHGHKRRVLGCQKLHYCDHSLVVREREPCTSLENHQICRAGWPSDTHSGFGDGRGGTTVV